MKLKTLIIVFGVFVLMACGKSTDSYTPESVFNWELVQTNEISEDLYESLFSACVYIDTARVIQMAPDGNRYLLLFMNANSGDERVGALGIYDVNFNKLKEIKLSSGEGPGDFSRLTNAGILSYENNIKMFDYYLNRFSWFDNDLDFIKTENLNNIQGISAIYNTDKNTEGFIVSIDKSNQFKFIECGEDGKIEREYSTPRVFSDKEFAIKCFENEKYVVMRSINKFLLFDKTTKQFDDITLKKHGRTYSIFVCFDGTNILMNPMNEKTGAYIYNIEKNTIHTLTDNRKFVYVDENHILELVKGDDKYFVKTYKTADGA